MRLSSLSDLLAAQLRDLRRAERHVLEVLPDMAKATSSPALSRLLDEERARTQTQIERLERALAHLAQPAADGRSAGLEGIVEDLWAVARDGGRGEVVDALLAGAALKMTHYQLAGYLLARSLAGMLNQEAVHRLIQDALVEEGDAEHRLTELIEELAPSASS